MKKDLGLMDYNMTQGQNQTQMTGAADASTSNIDIGREFSTSPISRQDLTAKRQNVLTDSASK